MTVSGAEQEGLPAFDRSESERARDGLVDELRADPRTRVLRLRGDRTEIVDGRLVFASPAHAGDPAEWAFLGRDAEGRALLAAVDAASVDDDTPHLPALRELGGALPAVDVDILLTGVALGRWLLGSPHCPACGTPMRVRAAGWARTCPACGRDEFPRTDPAIIATIASADDPDLLLLGSKAVWGRDRYSCFAGFVEAGESLEDTVVRELREEAGVAVTDIRYSGSQPWPYPRSLMVGFHTRAVVDESATADGDEIVEVRWFDRDEIGAALRGEGDILLPGPAAIAHRLIAQWHEGVG